MPEITGGVVLAHRGGMAPLRPLACMMLGCALLGAVGCGAATGLAGRTEVTGAQLATRTPLLPGFFVRVAEAQLSLTSEETRALGALAAEADAAMRPVDQARIVFLETLARGIEDGALGPTVDVSRERLIRAATQAAPALRSVVERLHALLSPAERAFVVDVASSRLDRWAASWPVVATAPSLRARYNDRIAELLAEPDPRRAALHLDKATAYRSARAAA